MGWEKEEKRGGDSWAQNQTKLWSEDNLSWLTKHTIIRGISPIYRPVKEFFHNDCIMHNANLYSIGLHSLEFPLKKCAPTVVLFGLFCFVSDGNRDQGGPTEAEKFTRERQGDP